MENQKTYRVFTEYRNLEESSSTKYAYINLNDYTEYPYSKIQEILGKYNNVDPNSIELVDFVWTCGEEVEEINSNDYPSDPIPEPKPFIRDPNVIVMKMKI